MKNKTADHSSAYSAMILSFLIPVFLLACVLFKRGIYPGGPNTVLIYDLGSQYLSFFGFLGNIGNGFNNYMYQTLSGLGGGCYGSLSYYTGSPLSWIASLFSASNIPTALYFILLIKIGLCGLAFALFLKLGHLKIKRLMPVLFFSACYALMSYDIVNLMNPMFLDGVILLPIVILSVDFILDGKKGVLLFLSVFACLCINYYIAFIVILFSVIWFVFRVMVLGLKREEIAVRCLRCLIPGALGSLCASFVIIPILLDMSRGRGNESIKTGYGIVLRNIFSVLRHLLPFSYDGLLNNDLPFIYMGTVSLILLVIFFVSKAVDRKMKIASAAVILFFILSFILSLFDSFWTAFRVANGYPARYSFAFCFFVLYIACLVYDRLTADHSRKMIMDLAIAFVCFAELFFNADYILGEINNDISPYIATTDYEVISGVAEACENIISSDSDGFKRTSKFWNFSQNDGMLYGIPTLDYYSSSYNSGLHSMLGLLGLEQHYNHVTDKGMTPFVSDLLGINYQISYISAVPGPGYEYIGSYDQCNIWKNTGALPVAYKVADITEAYSDDYSTPFEFQNIVSRELSGVDDIFSVIDHEVLSYGYDQNNGLYIKTIKVTLEEYSDLWMYADPSYIDFGNVSASDRESMFPAVFYNDSFLSYYQSALSTYCVQIGSGEGEIILTLASRSEIGDVHFATFNSEEAARSIGILRNGSCHDITADRLGIRFGISMDEPGPVLITLPYEDGYRIKVDGRVQDYHSYRNALLVIDLEAGEHKIELSYFTPGLKAGILISLIFLIAAIFYFINFNKINEKKIEAGKGKRIITALCVCLWLVLLAASLIGKSTFVKGLFFWTTILLPTVLAIVSVLKDNNHISRDMRTPLKAGVAVVCIIVSLICIIPMSFIPYFNGEIPDHRNQYELMAESVLNGRLWLDLDVDPALAGMDNPYDPEAREQLGVSVHWDHAFYNGRYYMYFGIVPVLILFLPFRLLTGMPLLEFHATQIFTLLFIIGFFLLTYRLACSFFKRVPYALYLSIVSAMCIISVNNCIAAPALYNTAVSASLCFAIWSMVFFRKAFEKANVSELNDRYLVLGALFGALVFGCRPNIGFFNIIYLPVLFFIIRSAGNDKLSAKIKHIVSFVLPYVLVGLLLMIYNYLRFDSVFEFGQSYQLTVADQHMYMNFAQTFDINKFVYCFVHTFTGFYGVTDTFPYISYYGILVEFPIFWLFLPLLAVCVIKRKSVDRKLRILMTSLNIAAIVIILSTILMSPIPLLERYKGDELFLLCIVLFVMICVFSEKARSLSNIVIILSFATFVVAFLQYFAGESYIQFCNPELIEYYGKIFCLF